MNYSQINSPKTHPLVMECRSLTVLSDGALVARSFPRFFNYGEALDVTSHFILDGAVAQEKIDGSLIKMFYWRGDWRIQTRESFADSYVNGSEYTWSDLVRLSLPNFDKIEADLRGYTLVFELCSPYNVVVHRHQKTEMFLLATFDGQSECDIDVDIQRPRSFTFGSKNAIDEFLAQQHPTFEGLVFKDINGMRLKMKTESYVALHRLHNNGNYLLPKNVLPLIWNKEVDEVACYFPKITEVAARINDQVQVKLDELDTIWDAVKDCSKKEIATSGLNFDWISLIFTAKTKGGHPRDYITLEFLEKWLKCISW